MLDGTVPTESDPKYGFVSNPEIKDRDSDGYPELMVKFDRSEVQNMVTIGNVTLTITGEIEGLRFEGSDVIRVIGEGEKLGDGAESHPKTNIG